MNDLRKHLNAEGFSHILIICVLLLLAISAFAGLRLVTHKKSDSSTKSAATVKSAGETPKPSASQTNTSQAATPYLTISEWNVRIPEHGVSVGTYYTHSDSTTQTDPGNVINIFATRADALTGPAGISCKGEYIAYVSRSPVSDRSWDDPNNGAAFVDIETVGGYKFGITTHKQYIPGCFSKTTAAGDSDPDEATAEKFQTIVNQFVSDFKQLQPL